MTEQATPMKPSKAPRRKRWEALLTVFAVLGVVGSFLFQTNLDFRYSTCVMGALGYLDMFPGLQEYFIKCIARSAEDYVRRDYQPGEGRLIPIHEFDCRQNFTWEKLIEETQYFSRPVVCRGLLLDTPCTTKWSLEYFRTIARPNETFVVQNFSAENLQGRPAFGQIKIPLSTLSGQETMERMIRREPLFTSFDNAYFKIDHPELLDDMRLSKFFPGVEFILNTLFISGFPHSTLGSVFHAAPNENFFFQCRGQKHWFYVPPKQLKYTGAYFNRGVLFTSLFLNESLVIDRMPIYEAFLEEGDMMFNPSYWLHAVGTLPGDNIAVANRVWMKNSFLHKNDRWSFLRPLAFTNFYNSPFMDTMWYLQLPKFVASIIWTKLTAGNLRMVQQIQTKATYDLTEKTQHSKAGRGILRVRDSK